MTYAIKIVNKSGSEVYLCEGLGSTPAHFPSRAAAERQKQFMLIGMASEVQSINVVKYPKGKTA